MVHVVSRDQEHGGESLDEVAFAVDRAGAGEPRGAESSSEEGWRDLLAGRVKVVERFERDGRTFVVAQRGSGKARGVRLTERETAVVQRRVRGAPLKDIAADLGVSISTVAKALKRALGKLGVESQAELIALLGGGVGQRAGQAG